jgi:hypothetical protein
MKQACYRHVDRYKYQLIDDYELGISITDKEIDHPFIQLDPSGRLTIRKYYSWDGPSGPTIDTVNFMRGSLVHDALYQLMRLGLLDLSYRQRVDDLLREHILADGMSRFRAWYVHKSVRAFGGNFATPKESQKEEIHCVPTT